MKRATITTIAMLPTVLLATPGIIGAIDTVAWIILGGAIIGQWDDLRVVAAVSMAMFAFPLGVFTLCVIENADI